MALLETVCTKPMCWLAVLHSRLWHVSKSAPINSCKVIALALCRPVFEAHNFLFKLRYASARRRLSLLRREQPLQTLEDMPLELDLDLIEIRGGLDAMHGLKDILRRLQAAQSASNFSNHPRPLSR